MPASDDDADRGQASGRAAEAPAAAPRSARGCALAGELFGAAPGRICHAILLTDGENQHETPEELDAVLADVRGALPVRLPRRRHRLGGQRAAPDRLDAARHRRHHRRARGHGRPTSSAMIETAMGKATGNVSLRVWTPQGAHVAFVRQVAPTIEELTDRATAGERR